jgi:hypothetical protein
MMTPPVDPSFDVSNLGPSGEGDLQSGGGDP